MIEVKNFFINNSSQIWTLISVIIGGLVTYLATSAAEKRKYKRQVQKETMEQVLVPYCICLEETIDELYIIYRNPTKLYDGNNFLEWTNNLKKPFKYLKPARRIFLTQGMRKKLQNYKNLIENFEQELEYESINCTIKYKHYLSSKLKHFSDVPSSMLIRYSTDRIFENKIKIAILNKGSLSLLDNFICINFVENDDPDNYKQIDVHIDEDVRLTWGTIKYGSMDISDIENQETRLALNLLDFVEKNVTNEKDILDNFIDDTKSSGYLTEIIDILNDMVEDLFKKIDKITK